MRESLRIPAIFRLLLAFAIVAVSGAAHAQGTSDLSTRLAKLNRSIAGGQIEEAISLARSLDDAPPEGAELSIPLAQIANSLKESGKLDGANEFFRRSCAALDRPAAASLPPTSAVIIRLVAASWFVQIPSDAEALGAVQKALADPGIVTDAQRNQAVLICLKIGGHCLPKGDAATAYPAYSLAAIHAVGNQRAEAMLGAAWSAAMIGDRPIEAARGMVDFVDTFPQHPDAPLALQMGAACLKRVSDDQNAALLRSKIVDDLVTRWAKSKPAAEVAKDYVGAAIDEIPASVRRWVLGQNATDDVHLVAMAMRIAATESNSDVWDRCQLHLGHLDTTGQVTADLLDQLSSAADAERLVTFFLAPPEQVTLSAAAREAACRWVGRHQHWTMLALASGSTSPDSDDPSRTVAMERLFAEALMQSGRREEAHRWWTHLVDTEKVTDFATLLRCAETESSLGEVDLAARRIDAAKAAAENNGYRSSLVAMLAAELAVRRLRFDQARGELESVVRSSQTDAALRGRAQWMIGETFYLQERFSEAIEAYRSVAGMDPKCEWAAAALLQAGKSFEQLGRTRDAAVCYSTLMSRHGECQYAPLASRRLAALSNSGETNSNKTLRR
ncbi:tetratricopeptide repeat protein [Planctomycetes bacterium CA13]